jgi:hypothetical protein
MPCHGAGLLDADIIRFAAGVSAMNMLKLFLLYPGNSQQALNSVFVEPLPGTLNGLTNGFHVVDLFCHYYPFEVGLDLVGYSTLHAVKQAKCAPIVPFIEP